MNSVIVVEGIHDEMRIRRLYPDAMIVTTNGREISDDTIALIKKLSLQNEIIIFTDPDTPGERIRAIITEAVPTAKQAFLRKKDAISKNKKKVGIEHASDACIQDSLSQVYSYVEQQETITWLDLFELGLNGTSNSAFLREKISDQFNIGRPNAKTFLKRLNMLQINKEELEKICQEILEKN